MTDQYRNGYCQAKADAVSAVTSIIKELNIAIGHMDPRFGIEPDPSTKKDLLLRRDTAVWLRTTLKATLKK